MNAEQRAIIAAAEKDGVSPIERDARLIVHGMVNATRDQMRKHQVGYDKMGEAQQDSVIAELTTNYEELAVTIARALASAGSPAVIMTCKKLEVSNGTFTGIVKSDQAFYNELISKVQDKGEVVVALYERQYRDGMEAIKGDKDQRTLPLDADDKPAKGAKADKAPRVSSPTSAATLAKKATDLPPKLLEDARAFIKDQQVCTVSGIQNGLKIGMVKATAVLDQMCEEGICTFVGDSKSGEYQLVRNTAPKDPEADGSGLTFDGPEEFEKPEFEEVGDAQPAVQVLTNEIYEKVKAQVLKTKKVSIGALSVSFSLDDEVVEQAIDRLELEGVITEENEMGVRSLAAAE